MTHRRDFLKASAASLLAAAAAPRLSSGSVAASAPVRTGGVKLIPIMGGKYKVWTKKVGRGALKVLLLHGGPGGTHEYFECFEDFLPKEGIEFYYYDQLGSYYSDQPKDESLWTVERFTEEVEEVRRGLGLDQFVLLGHSWGGMLGIEYALKYQQHLKGLVLSNMTASIKGYVEHAAELRKALPPETLAILDKYEAKGDYQNPEYLQAMMGVVYTRHLCRLDPWPDAVQRTFRHFADAPYNTLQGPNEFVITGRFKDWDRWADLPRIKVPTLVIGAGHDTMDSGQLQRMAKLLPRGRFHFCPNGSHMDMWDDQAAYFRGLLPFLKGLQAKG
ncbi:MAG TPA: proline iminopeptidase-family hydrolase [Holophagaceae bacterium]|nr:proline iminopeptidase-family hydrolase [Holophagaceae bacterium]